MQSVVVFCLVAIPMVLGQFHHGHHQGAPQPIKENRHLHALQQPHLPKDNNVLAETQKFLHRFAELKAIADAAPDPPSKHHSGHNPHHQRASHHQPATHFQQNLHHQPIHHQPAHPQPAHHQPVHRQPTHHQPIHHQPAHHRPSHPAPIHHQPKHHNNNQGHAMVPVVNQHGIIINPNRYPGPLAHHIPAAVHG